MHNERRRRRSKFTAPCSAVLFCSPLCAMQWQMYSMIQKGKKMKYPWLLLLLTGCYNSTKIKFIHSFLYSLKDINNRSRRQTMPSRPNTNFKKKNFKEKHNHEIEIDVFFHQRFQCVEVRRLERNDMKITRKK